MMPLLFQHRSQVREHLGWVASWRLGELLAQRPRKMRRSQKGYPTEPGELLSEE